MFHYGWINIYVIFLIFHLKLYLFNCTNGDSSFLDLPTEHLSQYLNRFPEISKSLPQKFSLELKKFLNSKNYNKNACWGYENYCSKDNRYSNPNCSNNANSFNSGKSRSDIFYEQADFGYVQQQIEDIMVLCKPTYITDSSLECSKYLRFCRGRNIKLNLKSLSEKQAPMRYQMDVLKQGDLGGFCEINYKILKNNLEHMSPLQSWAPEIRFFEALNYQPLSDDHCDIIISKPVFIMKIDAASSMYHHFCDFFNLYLTLHVNQTHYQAFTNDVHILIWETYHYSSPFKDTFKAFTKNPIWSLNTFSGKAVCFKNIVFSLLPRMIFGLYYNTPIIQGCRNSGIFQAFPEFILHRLKIKTDKSFDSKKLRVTFLVRRTKYRRILNEDELFKEISKEKEYIVQKVSFDRSLSFIKQLEIIRNTDILIGIHGAGLTHLLFLPNHAAVFELYNCEDPNCYKDLARLRGIHYITWEDDSKIRRESYENITHAAHAKFMNYFFDKGEFSRLVQKAAKMVSSENKNNYFENKDRDEL